MASEKTKLLLVNDDGINAPGLIALIRELLSDGNRERFEIRVVAPAVEHSGASHCISIHKPLRVFVHHYSPETINWHQGDDTAMERPFISAEDNDLLSLVRAWRVEGTPADCTQFALLHLFSGQHIREKQWKPDLVVSGINRGNNAGYNVIYSGTVAGAMEGSVLGYPSIALSLNHPTTYPSRSDRFPYHVAAKLAVPLIEKLLRLSHDGISKGLFWNVNFPNVERVEDVKGIKLTKQGGWTFSETFVAKEKVSDEEFVYVRKGKIETDANHDTEDYDTVAITNGWIAVTPLSHVLDKISAEDHQLIANDALFRSNL